MLVLSRPGAPRHLHSFPTRRSSDLAAPPPCPRFSSPGPAGQRGRSRPDGSGAHRTGTRPGGAARSEEHTSELQSRGHLVCRLLLEKKKILLDNLHYCTFNLSVLIVV